MASYRLWLHPLHWRKSFGPLHIEDMQHAKAHDERIAILREVCYEASKHAVDMDRLTEVVVHPDALVARSEVVGNPIRLPLCLSQVCEYISESPEERADGALGFVAYACPMMHYTARGSESKAAVMPQGDVWVLIVTDGAPCEAPSQNSSFLLSQAVSALVGRGAISGDTSAFEAIDERTQKGGFGTVHFYRRRHDTNSRIYAGKLLNDREAKLACAECDYLLAARSHPNIVAFFGTFRFLTFSGERKWMIVTEGHSGGDVESQVRRRGAFPEREALQISMGVLKAVSHLHEHQLIHRDVKPANVVLASDGRAVLIDMGLVVHVSESARKKKTCGTPGFIAPEIYLRRGCQYKSDVFGCGALLYFAASGMAPFKGSSKNDIMKVNVRACVNFDDPRFLRIAPHTIELMRNMLQKKPSRRPKAPSACSSVTLVLEMTSRAGLPGETSHPPDHDRSRPATLSERTNSSAWQSMRERLRAFSSLRTDDLLSSFSTTSSAASSLCSSASGRGQKTNTKPTKPRFFLRAKALLGRAQQLARTTAEVTPL
eukprot:TRINITY_DN18293_c1_g2_i2.p1 TRINITY_DN18293_c1_g2~~TRINITY_DN18293_c1_g2_i2.p1  ORF type:complete len:544 (+),score=50.79 TRINITY_DN18293_c1_g2_i2:52-1683(+)